MDWQHRGYILMPRLMKCKSSDHNETRNQAGAIFICASGRSMPMAKDVLFVTSLSLGNHAHPWRKIDAVLTCRMFNTGHVYHMSVVSNYLICVFSFYTCKVWSKTSKSITEK